ncbi:transcriptional regulator [Streptomyces agglomeratus]|uniref:Transcriptional regulator n=1 Tax=Streptomyces agglomeratus TaxID=285458 RepID=A0A1E5P3U9_9ACTN|nr:ANTAR domain-containing protein [Streptomyces agglomeratus]OEJ24205.1 transcriptional regulator [Streptomyces agglomeratus]OEJ54282.1 transcriptional regulator [Streptomyces agglomeratus]
MLSEQEVQGPEPDSAVRRLSELAEQCARCAPASCGAVATIADGGTERRATATHPDLAALASVQLAVGDGPIPAALDRGGPVDAEDLLNEERWPAYRALALDSGVRASVTIPFCRTGIEVTVSLYSFRPGSLERAAYGPVGVLGEQVTAGLVRDRRYREALAEVDQLETALHSRAAIDQASGIVMHALGCDGEEAFAVLRQLSQRSNRKLAEVAQRVVEGRGSGLESTLARLAARP